jgi:hypothetical protein
MTPREVSRELRNVQEKYKGIATPTFSIRISDLARDAADAIDSLQTFVDHIGKLPTCMDCANTGCKECKPLWGETVRYNCPLHISKESSDDNI